MNTRARASRRQLIASGLAAGFGWNRLHSGRASAEAAGWSSADGLRLAGPYQGLASLDPTLARDLESNFIVRQVCRGLVGYDETLAPVPELASTIHLSDDQLTYTFGLREEARFHDGRQIEAEDIRFSLSRAVNPSTAGGDLARLPGPTYLRSIVGVDAVMRGDAAEISGIEVLDGRRVRISLESPSSTFLMKLAAIPASILDRHQDMSDPLWWTRVNSSGPYHIVSFNPDSELVLGSIGSWLGKEIAVDEIRFRVGLSAAQPVNLFQAGEIDLVPQIPPQLVSLVTDPATGMDGAFVLKEPEFGLSYIAFGNRHPPLDDVHIRRALQYVFPAARFAAASFDGRVHIPEGLIPPGMLAREWQAEMPPVDSDAARREIALSRYKEASAVPAIRVHAADIAPVEALRDVARDELGLAVEAVQVNWFDFLEGLSRRSWHAYSLFWGVDYPDPEALLAVLFGSDSTENYTGYSNLALDALLDEARTEFGDEARQNLYAEAQQVLLNDAAIIPLYSPIRYTLARKGMSSVPTSPMGLLGLESLS